MVLTRDEDGIDVYALGTNQCGQYRVRGSGTCHKESKSGVLQEIDMKLVREYISEDLWSSEVEARAETSEGKRPADAVSSLTKKRKITEQSDESPKSEAEAAFTMQINGALR